MKRGISRTRLLLLAVCCVSIAAPTASCVKLPRRAQAAADSSAHAELQNAAAGRARISINQASREELEKLPGVGAALAARIVEHRERYGPFHRPEHLMMVRGISESRFRQMRALVTAE